MSLKPKPGTSSAGRPPAAIEITPEGVLAAALSGSSVDHAWAFRPLPSGAIVPHIEEQNVRSPEALATAIRSALSQVSPRTRDITLILPDTLVRVFVLDFDTLPSKAAEALSVVRFRLRKTVPFDVEHASVSYQVVAKTETELKVLAAVVPGPILAEYEFAVRAAGYEPGVVLSSSLAALEAVDDMEAVLSANLSTLAITTSIANGQDLLLYRTLDLPQDHLQRIGEIQRSIAVAAAYFEDKLGARPRKLHYTGILKAADFSRTVADPSFTIVEWVQKPEDARPPCLKPALPASPSAGEERGKAMKIALNLATRPFTDLGPATKRLRVAIIALAVLCVLGGVALHLFDHKAADARARERAVDNQIAAIRAERQNAEATMRRPANAELLAQSVATQSGL